MEFLDILGWASTICFSLCALPEVIHARKHNRVGLTWGLLILWLVGELCIIVPIAIENPIPYLLVNYGINIAFLIYLIKVKLKQPPLARSTNIGKSTPTSKSDRSINL